MDQNKDVKIWATGRRGGGAVVTASVNRLQIMATAERYIITAKQMGRALRARFPRHTFFIDPTEGADYWTARADRFAEDGAEDVESD